MTRPKAQAIHL